AVALRVDAPPAEVGADPLGRDGFEAAPGVGAQLVQRLPGVLLALQAFDSLCFGFGHKKKKARVAAGFSVPFETMYGYVVRADLPPSMSCRDSSNRCSGWSSSSRADD